MLYHKDNGKSVEATRSVPRHNYILKTLTENKVKFRHVKITIVVLSYLTFLGCTFHSVF